jgi:mevalonate kinase
MQYAAFGNTEAENDAFQIFVPGRLCLFGEHSDWAGAQRAVNADIARGEAIVTGIDLGVFATVMRHDDFVLCSSLPGEPAARLQCPMSGQSLKQIAETGGYFSYVAGVASYILDHYRVGGLEINVTRQTLPVKRGLSSSAAICVLVAKAFNRMYDLRLSVDEEMRAAYFGERRTPSRCGRLDQACVFGVRPVHMVFDGVDIESTALTPAAELHFVFADLMAYKDTIKILAELHRSFPYPRTERDVKLHEALGADNHVIVSEARRLIENGDAPALGALMTQAQRLFDEKIAPACPEELAAPKLHQVLHDPVLAQWVYGGKGVGSQGDGTVQFLARDGQCQQKLVQYLKTARRMDAYEFTLPGHREARACAAPEALTRCGA